MTVKEIADSFGFKINELVDISGYSKQGLYDVVGGRTNVNSNRFNAFLDHLKFISISIYQQDIEKARSEKEKRDRLIKELKEGDAK